MSRLHPKSTRFPYTTLFRSPPLFVRALLLAEDSAFFSHHGLDLGELPKALAANWAEGGSVRGASTLTQQLAKNLFLTREDRKSTRLNSSHLGSSYAVFCLKK